MSSITMRAALALTAVVFTCAVLAASGTPARYVTSVASGLVGEGLAAAAPADAAAAGFQEVPHPGVRMIPNVDRCVLGAVQGLNRFYRGRSREVVAGGMTSQVRVLAIHLFGPPPLLRAEELALGALSQRQAPRRV